MPRLIDADALIEYLNNNVPLKYFMGRDIGKADKNLFHLLNVIREAPTVDQVKHGRWIVHPSGEFGSCGLCFEQVDFPEYKGDIGRYNKVFHYCPNCGAKMDQEANT